MKIPARRHSIAPGGMYRPAWLTESAIFVVLVVLVALIVPISGVTGSSGTSTTMRRAAEVLSDGWRSVELRPLYYLLVSWTLALGDGTVRAAFMADRILFAADLLAIYVLARVAFDRRTALTAFALCFTAFGLHYAAGVFNGDPSTPLFPLLALAVLVHGYRGSGVVPWAIAGVLFALGAQIKETALPLLALPLLALVAPALRRASRPSCIGAFYLGAAATMAVFAILVERPDAFLGDAHPSVRQPVLGFSEIGSRSIWLFFLKEMTLDLPRNVYLYVRHYLAPYYPIVPLMLAGLAAALWRIVSRRAQPATGPDAAAALVALAVCLLSPGIIIQGEMGERVGHGMPLHFLLYLLAAWWGVFVALEWPWVKRLAAHGGLPGDRLLAVAVGLAVIAQLAFPGRSTLAITTFPQQAGFGGHFPLTFWRDAPFTEGGRYAGDKREIAEVVGRLPGNTVFAGAAAYPGLRRFAPDRLDVRFIEPRVRLPDLSAQHRNKRLIGIDTYHQFRSFVPRYRALVLYFAEDFAAPLRGVETAHVVLSKSRYAFLQKGYFTGAAVRRVTRIGDSMLIEVDTRRFLAEVGGREAWISDRFRGDMAWLADNFPDEVDHLRRTLAIADIDLDNLLTTDRLSGALSTHR